MLITYLYSSRSVTFSGLAGDCTAAFTLSSGSSSACDTRIMLRLCTEVAYTCTSKVRAPIDIMRKEHGTHNISQHRHHGTGTHHGPPHSSCFLLQQSAEIEMYHQRFRRPERHHPSHQVITSDRSALSIQNAELRC